jgi:transposase
MSIVDAAFAAVPRDLWSDGPLWRAPDDHEAAHWLRHAGAAEPPPAWRPRVLRGVSASHRAEVVTRRAQVAALHAEGLSKPQIAEALGVTVGAVDYDLRELRAAEGRTGVAAALNAEHAARRARIYALLDTGHAYREVADAIGVSMAQIRRAVVARNKEARP